MLRQKILVQKTRYSRRFVLIGGRGSDFIILKGWKSKTWRLDPPAGLQGDVTTGIEAPRILGSATASNGALSLGWTLDSYRFALSVVQIQPFNIAEISNGHDGVSTDCIVDCRDVLIVGVKVYAAVLFRIIVTSSIGAGSCVLFGRFGGTGMVG